MVFKADWNINIANLGAIGAALIAVISAWYNLKAETAQNTRDVIVIQTQISQITADSKAMDLRQDQKRDQVVTDLKETMKDNKNEIKTEIRDLSRDLRSDISRIRK